MRMKNGTGSFELWNFKVINFIRWLMVAKGLEKREGQERIATAFAAHPNPLIRQIINGVCLGY